MTTHEQQNNMWFGLSLFLMGLIAGAILMMTVGGKIGAGSAPSQAAPSAPTAPTAQVPQKSANEIIADAIAAAGVDKKAFEACVANNDFTALINDQMTKGQAAGVSGTPGNIVVHLASGKAKLVSGAQPLQNFKTVIDDMLKNGAKADTDLSATQNTPKVDFTTDRYRGSTKAKVAVIEYSDFQCPFCHRVHPTYKQIMDAYGSDVVWVYRHFPLSFHPDAMPFAIGSECVRKLRGNDAFWKYADVVMKG